MDPRMRKSKGGNHWLFRNIFGWLLPPLVQFLKLPATPTLDHELMSHKVYQDVVIPINECKNGMDLAEQKFNIWPIILYPCKIYTGRRGLFPEPRAQDVVPGKDYAMYMDLGVYGTPPAVHRQERIETVRSISFFVHKLCHQY